MKGFATVFAAFIFIGASSAYGQNTVTLTQIVLTPTRKEIVGPAAIGAKVVNIKTSNEGVATAFPFRANQVQIVGVAYGKTTVEFFDTTNRILYIQPVWVEKVNPTGGGGSGYNPRLAQLPQIVMLVNRTENAHTPNDSLAKISGVASSNEKVATARIDPPRGIQISSKTLGDTWINFTNNTTGITYQVHVWVTNDPKLVTKSPGTGPNSDTKPLPNPKPKPLAMPVGGGKIDPCLVGEWVSEKLDNTNSGGAGVRLSIEGSGKITIDYSAMQPIFDPTGVQTTAKGLVIIHMLTSYNRFAIERIEQGQVTYMMTNPNGISWAGADSYGGFAVPVGAPYTCTQNTFSNWKQSYKRKAK